MKVLKHAHYRLKLVKILTSIYELLEQSGFNHYERAVFKGLFSGFYTPMQFDYYRVMTLSDGKYTLTIRKDEDIYDIKFRIEDYANKQDTWI